MPIFYRLLSLSILLLFSACKTGTQEDSGTVLGGLAGAAIGSQFGRGDGRVIGVAAGAILGAIIGNKIGKNMDDTDRMRMQQSTNSALERSPSNQTTAWRNPDSGYSGTVTPMPSYKNEHGQDCREFTQTITVGGETKKAFGRACRQPHGDWKIVP